MSTQGSLYTIGYAAFALEDFMAALQAAHMDAVVDVRAAPERSFFPEYRRQNISASLRSAGIQYKFFGSVLGARPLDDALYTNDKVDFAKIWASQQFREVCANLQTALERNMNICLMCAQKDPIICHRSILIARYMAREYPQTKIRHFHARFMETQAELDQRVLELYHKGSYANSLLAAPTGGMAELDAAYLWQAGQIAWQREEKDQYEWD